MAQQCLEISPSQVYFRDVVLGKAYNQLVAITNRASTSIEATIRPSSSERYSVHPKHLKLKGGQTCDVELRLKVRRFAFTDKGVHQGQRDAIHVKTAHFSDQKFFAHFFLSPVQDHGRVDNQQQEDHSNQERPSIRLYAPASPPSPIREGTLERTQGLHVTDTGVPVHSALRNGIQSALAEERAVHERRNQKVFHVLQEKDKIIHELQTEHSRLHHEIRALGTQLDQANQERQEAQRAAKSAVAQIHQMGFEQSTASQDRREEIARYEAGLRSEMQNLQAQVEALEQEKHKEVSSLSDEVKTVQQQLHHARVQALTNEEQKLRAEAEAESLKRKLSEWDAIMSDLKSQIEDARAAKTAELEKLQAEHQHALDSLQSQILELQNMQLCNEGVSTGKQSKFTQTQETLHEEANNNILQHRVSVLEAANASLEDALINGCAGKRAAICKEMHLTSDLLMASFPTDSQPDAGDTIVPSQCHVEHHHQAASDAAQRGPWLEEVIVTKEQELAAQKVRILKLESLHKLAQDSALGCEAELVTCHQALAAMRNENECLVCELQKTK
eukprot:jgi/Ulvmu1/8274/UM041_0085.1